MCRDVLHGDKPAVLSTNTTPDLARGGMEFPHHFPVDVCLNQQMHPLRLPLNVGTAGDRLASHWHPREKSCSRAWRSCRSTAARLRRVGLNATSFVTLLDPARSEHPPQTTEATPTARGLITLVPEARFEWVFGSRPFAASVASVQLLELLALSAPDSRPFARTGRSVPAQLRHSSRREQREHGGAGDGTGGGV